MEKLPMLFRKIKKELKLDFAFTNASRYGDCNGCVWAEIGDKYGDNATGIFAKYWTYGGNKSDEKLSELDYVRVSHNIKEEDYATIVEILSVEYDVEPKEYDEDIAIKVSLKK